MTISYVYGGSLGQCVTRLCLASTKFTTVTKGINKGKLI